MSKTLTFLHTSPVHVATFDRLLAELDSTIRAAHIVDTSLLDDARTFGITAALSRRVEQTIANAMANNAAMVVCTCSTIGGCAEQAGSQVVRIDRAMAEQAVALGSQIAIVAALPSTLAPTRELLREVATHANKSVTLNEVLCLQAWPHFEAGDQESYLTEIADCLRQAAPTADVIVLAQASMAGAVALCPDLTLPILSSPRLGLSAAIATYRSLG
jgi:hypothetical protein